MYVNDCFGEDSDACCNAAALVRVLYKLAWMLPGNGCSTGHLVTGLPGGKVDLRLTF